MQIVWIPWAHIPVIVELDIPETEKLAMVRNLPTNQPTNKQNAKLILNLITISLYFQQAWNFFCNDGLEKTVTNRSCAMRRLKKFKPLITLLLFSTISKPAPLVSNQGHTNHPKAENESASVESKINEKKMFFSLKYSVLFVTFRRIVLNLYASFLVLVKRSD